MSLRVPSPDERSGKRFAQGATVMKYLDEYRDAGRPGSWPTPLRGPSRGPGRSWKSAAGRRTRSSSTGSTNPPADDRAGARAGLPGCVTSLEMIDRAHAIASRPDVIFCSFGDMLRVPGSRGDLLQVKVAGRRCADRLFAAGCGEPRRRQSGRRGGLLRHRLRDHGAAQCDGGMAGAQAEAEELQRAGVACAGAAVDDGDPAVAGQPGAGVPGPGHVCTVMGYRNTSRSPGGTGCRSSSPASSRWTCWRAY